MNPKAGKGELPEDLAAALDDLWRGRRISGRPPGELVEAIGPYLKAGERLFVAAGGDGTVNAVVNALMQLDAPPDTTLGVVPLGTGNDLAASLGSRPEGDAVREMVHLRHTRPWDVGLCTASNCRRYFANAATGGFSGQVQEKLSKENRAWGPLAYMKSAFEALQDPDTFELHLTLDGKPEHFTCLMLALMLGRTIGGGVPVGDERLMNDGLFDVFALELAQDRQLADVAGSAVRWMTSDASEGWDGPLLHRTAKVITLKSTPAMPISLDGELLDCGEASFEILPARLQVLTLPDGA